MAAPTTSDGKGIFLPNLFPGGVTLYYAGFGDDPTNGKGEGPIFNLSSSVAGDEELTFSFNDWIYAAGGALACEGAQLGDWISLKITAPETTVTPNATNTGNCFLADDGKGNVIVIVPAAGNGTHDVDLAIAVPVPADENAESIPTGFWDWSAPDEGKGTITPSATPGKARYHLMAAEIPLARFVKVALLGAYVRDITVPAIKPKKVLPHWQWKVALHNAGHAGLKVAWEIICARARTL